jgi:hypothetical protein
MDQSPVRRLELHDLLIGLLGSEHVYFQPPPTVQMVHPCIIYKRDSLVKNHADNEPYKIRYRYQVIVVDSNPDSDIPVKFAMLPMCSFERFYTADNLNHDVYNLYY